MEIETTIKKFKIGGHSCYLKYGQVTAENCVFFSWLDIGDICYLDLTVPTSIQDKHVYEVAIKVVETALIHRVPLRAVIKPLLYQRLITGGATDDLDIPLANSILDYVARFLELKFLGEDKQGEKV